jgi:NYN domain
LPELEIEPGKFHKNRVKREYVDRPGEFAYVWDYKEKRSDVNLAARLLQDAYEGNCEQAAVVSADSDLVTPIKIANERLPEGVVILNPNLSGTVRQLEKVAERYIWITESHLRTSQLPYRIRGREGKILQRPRSW